MIDIQEVFVLREALPFPLTKRVLRHLKIAPHFISSLEEVQERLSLEEDAIGAGKRILVLDVLKKGKFIKPCPCTPEYLGCGYLIINADLNCPLDCSYCILQGYLDNPWLTVFVNQDKIKDELGQLIRRRRGFFRIGTGELADSLALDFVTERSRDLLEIFAPYPRAILELKTKTTSIELLLASKPISTVVIAWSLNSEEVARQEEHGAPSARERIQAAREVIKKGYRVAFHFDPLVWYPGWQEGYGRVVEDLMTQIPAAKIAWISLGAIRFPPLLKEIIQNRFPKSLCLTQEFIRGKDGKYRLFRPMRIEMYRQLIKHFQSSPTYSQVKYYLCMESPEVWNEVFGHKKRGEKGFDYFLSRPS
jgi:spore photoproduct lyase